jgi:hypothetical protein
MPNAEIALQGIHSVGHELNGYLRNCVGIHSPQSESYAAGDHGLEEVGFELLFLVRCDNECLSG